MSQGTDLVDLEEDTEATLGWQDAEDGRTAAHLSRWSGRAALGRLFGGLPAGRLMWAPWRCGAHWFVAEASVAGVTVCAAGHDGARMVLFDPAIEPGRSVREFWPSPDGRFVVLGVLHGSSEAGDLRIVDPDTGTALGSPALFTTMTRVAWLPDSSGLYFNGIAFDGPEMRGAVYSWRPGDEPELVPLDCAIDSYPVPSADGRHVLITAGSHHLRPVALLDRGTNSWDAIDTDETVHLDGVIIDGHFVAITTYGADRGRIVRTTLADIANPARWDEVSGEGEAVLRALSLVGRKLVVSELADACGQLRIIDLDTGDQATVPVPVKGALTTSGLAAPLIGVPMCRPSGGHPEITFLASGPASPPRAFAYDLDSGRLASLDHAAGYAATATERVVATARDGTRVPCVVTHLESLDRSRPQPTLVLAYGGFNLPNTPRYQLAAMAFVLSGGVVAYPLLRGGGEFGDAWWHAGRRAAKQHTFDDLYTVCERLIDLGITTSGQLALQGGSNGGVTAAVAIAQRPDLFRVVVATAPLTDLLRHHRAGRSEVTTAATVAEFGDPDDPADAAVLRSWSPFQNLGPAPTSPAVLVAAADNDVRTPPWHARKLVARLHAVRPQAAAFLRIWRNYGHGTGGGTTSDRTTEWLGFVMAELGMTPSVVPS